MEKAAQNYNSYTCSNTCADAESVTKDTVTDTQLKNKKKKRRNRKKRDIVLANGERATMAERWH